MIPNWFKEIPDQYKTQKMCNEAVQNDPEMLEHVPDQYKTQKMCNEAVQRNPDPEMLEHVPDQFVILQEMWYEEFIDDDVFITWYKGYKQRKAQKAQIKEELMPVAWHPDRWWNWCVPEDEKKELEKYLT